MRDNGQLMRFNKVELGLFKNLFADNENLLFTIRKFLLQFEITKEEQDAINAISKVGMTLIRKHFLGGLDPDAPLNQLADIRRGYGVDMQTKDTDEMIPIFKAKELQIDFFEQEFDILEGKDVGRDITLKNLASRVESNASYYEYYINIMAWNNIISFIDSNLQQIQFLAGQKDETVEETQKRLKKDSSK